jgi:hypothetical protein
MMIREATEHLEKAKAFSLPNNAGECDCFSYRADCKSCLLARLDPVAVTYIQE